jgi:hypothetical protein
MVKGYFSSIPIWGAVVEDVRKIFKEKNDATIYIPSFTK